MDSSLLGILRCPETGQKLTFSPPDTLTALNTRILQGHCLNQSGIRITEPVLEALIREDQTKLYPIRDGIPLLLADESIAL